MLRNYVVLLGSVSAILIAGLVPDSYRVGSEARAQGPAPAPLPTVDLPPELNRVLRDYERHWQASDGAALSDAANRQ